MSTPAGCKPVGRWRIVKADIWDRAYLTSADRRQIAFGAPQACLDIEYSGSSIEFIWRASTKWTKSPAMAPPNCSTTARSRSNSPTTMAMRPSSKPVAGRSAERFVDG
jgi:hypothetical protein